MPLFPGRFRLSLRGLFIMTLYGRLLLGKRYLSASAFQAAAAPSRLVGRQSAVSPRILRDGARTGRALSYHHGLQQQLALFKTALQFSNPQQQQQRIIGSQRLYESAQPTSARSDTTIAPWQKDLNDAQIEAVTKPLYSVTRVIAGESSVLLLIIWLWPFLFECFCNSDQPKC